VSANPSIVVVFDTVVDNQLPNTRGNYRVGQKSDTSRTLHYIVREVAAGYCVECPQYSIRLEAVGYLRTGYLLPAFDDT